MIAKIKNDLCKKSDSTKRVEVEGENKWCIYPKKSTKGARIAHGLARQDKRRQGKTKQDKTRQDKARQDQKRRDKTSPVERLVAIASRRTEVKGAHGLVAIATRDDVFGSLSRRNAL
jgi:hypothetical protein